MISAGRVNKMVATLRQTVAITGKNKTFNLSFTILIPDATGMGRPCNPSKLDNLIKLFYMSMTTNVGHDYGVGIIPILQRQPRLV